MNFDTFDDLIKYVNKETEYQVIKKDDMPARNKIPYIHTQEGRKKLRDKGYFGQQYIWARMGYIFNSFKCKGCTIDSEVCKKCRAVRTIIKSL